MRISDGTGIIALAMLLASCGQPDVKEVPKTEDQVADQIEEDQSVIPCALDGQPMAKMCTFETANGEQGLTVVVRHPDGGFRRLVVTNDGNVVAADGAGDASFAMLGTSGIEVSVSGDKYQLPATMKGPE